LSQETKEPYQSTTQNVQVAQQINEQEKNTFEPKPELDNSIADESIHNVATNIYEEV
jgi:hypothetical protein